MAVSTASSAKKLFVDSKVQLSERIEVNVNGVGSIVRQIVKGSKMNEALMHTARNFALQEYAVDNSEMNLKRMQHLATHLHLHTLDYFKLYRFTKDLEETSSRVPLFQLDAIQKNIQVVEQVNDRLHQLHHRHMQYHSAPDLAR